ncbi:MAG: DUF11 domain-containing protein, partial [Saprospiraceae bacterium]|nr:DUF11 domain-containing protein [Saprospiraceae bacterium]
MKQSSNGHWGLFVDAFLCQETPTKASTFRNFFSPVNWLAILAFFFLFASPVSNAGPSLPSEPKTTANFTNSLTADLALVKTVNDNTPDQNQVVTFTLVVSNAGPNPATAAEITDVVPAGMTFVTGSQTGPGTYNSSNPSVTGVKWQNLFIANGGSVVLSFQATVTASGGTVITNFAQVTANAEVDPDSTPNNGNVGEDDGDIETVTVNNPAVVLTCPVNTTVAACQTQAAVNTAFATWLATASGTGGCNGVLTNNNTGAPNACGGSTTVTFTYTSTCAPLTTTCQATFTVTAAASPTPVFANCTNNTVSLGCNPFNLPSCAGIASGGFGGAVTASNSCGSVPVNCSAGTITISGCTRTQIFTFDATACGQTVTCTRTFTWNVVTPPSFNGTCGNGVINLGCNPATLPSCDPNVTASNECGPITVVCQVGAITSNGCNRSQTLTYVANAIGCGTFSTCTKIYNWQVSTSPVVFTNCDNTIDLGCNPATLPSCANIQQVGFGGQITASNDCGNISNITCSGGTITVNGCNRTQVFTILATPSCGPSGTCTRTFTWQVVTPPVFANCTSGTTDLGCNPGTLPSCDPTVTASSECGAATVVCTAGTITSNGCNRSQIFTYVATGACGLTSTCTRTFTWTVPQGASLTIPVNTTTPACQTQAAVNAAFASWLATATFTGGCNAVLTNNNTGAPPFCGGSTTVTFTVTNGCGPGNNGQATFTVAAAPPPSLTCPNPLIRPLCQTRAQDSIAMANWLSTLSFSGGCNGSINFNGFDGRPPSSCGGTKTLNLTYTSSCAAPLTCSSTFTIPAPTAPVLTCPTNTTTPFGQTQAQVNAAFATWLSTASGTGGCNGVLSNNNTGAPPATGGSTTVTFTYSQNPPSTPFSGACPFSTQTCQATFTVSSVPPVVLTCPTNTTVAACQTQAAVNTAFATWLATASGTGGCNGVLTNNNTGAPSACGGSTTVTFTYTSTCAPLTTTCQATFTVGAAPNPNLAIVVGTTINPACQTQAAVNATFATWLSNNAIATSGCNGVLTNNNTGAPSACGGSTTVIWTYTTSCAQPLTAQATFTVSAAPTVVLTCPINTTVAACQTQAAVNTAFATWLATASASGGCNGVLTNNNTGAPAACGGSTTVTFTYTSSCAPLTTTCQATFTVPAAPTVVLTCPTNTTAASCQTQAAVNTAFATWLVSASASGGCNGVLTNNNTGAPSACGGSTTVTFTYTSSCAPLTTTCQATFTVASSPVVLTCPVNTTTAACQTQAAVNTAFATWLATASASGGCNGVLTNNNTGAPSACGGSTTVTFTYTSSCAPLTTTCQATFTVPAAPTVVLTCPTNTTAAACQTQAAINTAFSTWLATASASGGCNGVLTNNNSGA